MNSKLINQLKSHRGILSEYLDYKFKPVQIAESCQRKILTCMGYDLGEQALLEQSLKDLVSNKRAGCFSSGILSQEGKPLCFTLTLPGPLSLAEQELELSWADGEKIRKLAVQLAVDEVGSDLDGLSNIDEFHYEIRLLELLPVGEHSITVDCSKYQFSKTISCTIAPSHCYQPEAIRNGKKIFGSTMQLYTLRSNRNWGIGDFTDLKNFIIDAAQEGIDIVGLNPLHALFPANPYHFSPYSPSNRSFLNVLYIDPTAIVEFENCSEAQALVADESFQHQLVQLRALDNVDYAWVSSLKLKVLQLLFENFVAVGSQSEARRLSYKAFLLEQGEALEKHALYDALHEHFFKQDPQLWGWPVWPEAFREPNSPEVLEFSNQYRSKVEFYKYLQFCAFEQLRDAQRTALDSGMSVGIYLDLAVGVDMSGSEVWSNQQLFCLAANVGAPPDALASGGQDWGFPPYDPLALQKDGYRLFGRNLQASMSCAGAVRFDHCVSLMRLWWIPKGESATEGAYVRYSIEDILSVLTIESQRNKCLVIGEDLGTVPKELTRVMREYEIYSYKVLYFETDEVDGSYITPEDYSSSAVATVTTHDLPTLISWWQMSDIALRKSLGMLQSQELEQTMIADRQATKKQLLSELVKRGYLPEGFEGSEKENDAKLLTLAVHRFLAASHSAIMISQLEDWLLMDAPVNVPGTHQEYPNWQRKLSVTMENFFKDEFVKHMCSIMRQERAR